MLFDPQRVLAQQVRRGHGMNPTGHGFGGEKRFAQADDPFVRMNADIDQIGKFIQQDGFDFGDFNIAR
jgi:hypothetical protein